MNRKLQAAILLGLLTLLPLAAYSQSSVYLGPHLGIQKSPDAENSNYLVGATLRIPLMPALGLEGDVGYRKEEYGNGAVTVKDWPLTVTGLLYPLPVLYGGIGGGWYNSTIDYSDAYNQTGIDDETTQDFGWHLAAGIELPTSSSIKLYGDVRYVFLDRKFDELPGAVLDGEKSDFYSINFGLLFGL
jgi:opacity protein-like surface antigen